MDNNQVVPSLPNGFYYCKNQNSLNNILKNVLSIDIKKSNMIVDIRHYPCIVTIDDRSLEEGKVLVNSITKDDIEKIIKFL